MGADIDVDTEQEDVVVGRGSSTSARRGGCHSGRESGVKAYVARFAHFSKLILSTTFFSMPLIWYITPVLNSMPCGLATPKPLKRWLPEAPRHFHCSSFLRHFELKPPLTPLHELPGAYILISAMPPKPASKTSQQNSSPSSQEELDVINDYLKFKAQLQVQKEYPVRLELNETEYDRKCSESLSEGLKHLASFGKESTTS